jgi:LPXTG-motif cell wall-anchored protein
MAGTTPGLLRGLVAIVAATFVVALFVAPAGAQDDGYGAYVGASTTVVPDDSAVASQQITLGEPDAAAPSSSALPQTLPFTGGDATQIALFGGLLLVGGLAVLGWRRRAAAA